jgi:hypothetical protein
MRMTQAWLCSVLITRVHSSTLFYWYAYDLCSMWYAYDQSLAACIACSVLITPVHSSTLFYWYANDLCSMWYVATCIASVLITLVCTLHLFYLVAGICSATLFLSKELEPTRYSDQQQTSDCSTSCGRFRVPGFMSRLGFIAGALQWQHPVMYGHPLRP